ncbi:MAG: serine/threonine-protein phosphatase [Pseudomonas sp.]|nr:serine/threonine-protein phosphatase [Pseudomonas sp.]
MSSRPIEWRSAGRTQQGQARPRNEDAFLDGPRQSCWAVADGMGGHQGGDVASQWVVRSLASLSAAGNLDQRVNSARQRLQHVSQQLAKAGTRSDSRGDVTMGSTVVALLLEQGRAACVWAGDSRCYLWREQRLYQLSRDHSLQQRLMDERQLSVAQARAHPEARALTRAIGARALLQLEILEFRLHPGDVFLLCSDGLYQGLRHRELGSAMSAGMPWQVVDRLFSEALRGAALDDLTAVVVQS